MFATNFCQFGRCTCTILHSHWLDGLLFQEGSVQDMAVLCLQGKGMFEQSVGWFLFSETSDYLTPVFFNLGSANSLLGSLRILKSALFWLSRFRHMLNNVSKIPRIKKGWKTLLYTLENVRKWSFKRIILELSLK